MAASIAGNVADREAILGRVRRALGRKEGDTSGAAAAAAYLATHARGPQPVSTGDRVQRFMDRAGDMGSSLERISERDDIPRAVARYIDGLTGDVSRAGVCWPELADLDWPAAGLTIESRPTVGHDKLGITGCFGAIAETGTLIVIPGAGMHTASALLPDTHVVVLRASDIVATMEDAFARVRSSRKRMPRAINLMSGPSRTGDIEQTIVLGAHGPYRVHILVLG